MCFTTCVLPFLLLGLTACSEPGRQVTRSTENGAFALTLKAKRGWVRVNEVLPIEVKLVSLNGPLDDGLDEEIEFLVNNGSLDEDELDAVLEAPDDEHPAATPPSVRGSVSKPIRRPRRSPKARGRYTPCSATCWRP